jgi:hypothetical protein
MSRLYLLCGLCGRQQADGILSRGYWGHLEVTSAYVLRACPTCKEQHSDWEARLQASTNPATLDAAAFPHADTSSGPI